MCYELIELDKCNICLPSGGESIPGNESMPSTKSSKRFALPMLRFYQAARNNTLLDGYCYTRSPYAMQGSRWRGCECGFFSGIEEKHFFATDHIETLSRCNRDVALDFPGGPPPIDLKIRLPSGGKKGTRFFWLRLARDLINFSRGDYISHQVNTLVHNALVQRLYSIILSSPDIYLVNNITRINSRVHHMNSQSRPLLTVTQCPKNWMLSAVFW